MTPQSVNVFGGFKVQGKGEDAAKRLLEDAFTVQEAGAFSVVLECVPPKLAALISKKLTIPTIGIGAGAGCDGQVLVYQDMLGMNMDFTPKFAKQFDNIGERMVDAFRTYMNEVQNGTFPTEKQSFVKSDAAMNISPNSTQRSCFHNHCTPTERPFCCYAALFFLVIRQDCCEKTPCLSTKILVHSAHPSYENNF